MGSSTLERQFETLWVQLEGPPFVSEYRFDNVRRWRFDCAWPDVKIAIELEGGTWVQGGHNRGVGYAANCAKYNAAAIAGWIVFRYTTDMLDNDPHGHLAPLVDFVRQKQHERNMQ